MRFASDLRSEHQGQRAAAVCVPEGGQTDEGAFPRRKNDRDAPPRGHTFQAAEPPRLTTAMAGCSLSAILKQIRRFSRAVLDTMVRAGGTGMFGISDLFQWERFVTPTVIKIFYWLAVVISVLLGLGGAVSSLSTMAFNPFVGMIFLIASLLGACMGVVLARIIAEFVLIVFRINEHLGAIRNRGQQI
jgi:hypothetical protein